MVLTTNSTNPTNINGKGNALVRNMTHNEHPCYPCNPCSKKLSTEQVLSMFRTRKYSVVLGRTRIPRIKRIGLRPCTYRTHEYKSVLSVQSVFKNLSTEQVPSVKSVFESLSTEQVPSVKSVKSVFEKIKHRTGAIHVQDKKIFGGLVRTRIARIKRIGLRPCTYRTREYKSVLSVKSVFKKIIRVQDKKLFGGFSSNTDTTD